LEFRQSSRITTTQSCLDRSSRYIFYLCFGVPKLLRTAQESGIYMGNYLSVLFLERLALVFPVAHSRPWSLLDLFTAVNCV